MFLMALLPPSSRQCTQGKPFAANLTDTHTHTPHLSGGACGSQRPVFPSLSSFSFGLPPGGPPSALRSSIVRMFLVCSETRRMSGPGVVEQYACGTSVLCCCADSVGSQFLRFLAAALQPSRGQCIPALASILEDCSRPWYLFFKHYKALSTFQNLRLTNSQTSCS